MQARLKELYEYDPEIDNFRYKYNGSRSEQWNKDFNGKEVKAAYSAGKRYIFINDALYNLSQVIGIYLGLFDWNLKPYTIKELVNLQNMQNKKIHSLDLNQLSKVIDTTLKGGLQEGITLLTNIKVSSKVNNRNIKDSSKAKRKVNQKVNEKYDVNDAGINERTGLPHHVYFHSQKNLYYVQIRKNGILHKATYQRNVEEAIEARNKLYTELNDKF